jgi:succinate dehydrogenase/fumarate reductase flavoprotein subunit
MGMKEEILEADVLCIGGGIAGLMAAIRAGELGVKVIVAEKSNTMRSGAGATGNDHFGCYIPEVHGLDIEGIIDHDRRIVTKDRIRTRNYVRTWMEKSFEIAKLWDSWGIPMKPTGKWEFSGHGGPGLPQPDTLKYAGQNQKKVLTMEARKRGVEIINRVTVFDLLQNESGITGAIGVSTREEKIVIFKAKSTVLTTGFCTRLYPGPTPGWMFNLADPPSTTGEGRAMAYRAGAELVNMEMPKRWAGPKYFARCGKGTWVGVIRDQADKPVGQFLDKPDKRYGDAIGDYYPALFEDLKFSRGPIYMDCRGISEDYYEYMMWGLSNEGNIALTNHLKEEGIDIRKNAVEFMTYEMSSRGGGILYNENCETSLKGLYAAGDEHFGGLSDAAIFGWIAGENAARYVKKSGTAKSGNKAMVEIKDKKEILNKIRNRETGATWQEVNIALSQIMYDYAGLVKSESLLRAGLTNLLRLKKKAYEQIMAKNQHELMHCLEVLNLFDIGEIVFVSALERKETRGDYVRSDYPFTNPQNNNKVHICKLLNGKPLTEWREIKELEIKNATNNK